MSIPLTYTIASIIRYGIKVLTNETNEEKKGLYFEDIDQRLNNSLKNVDPEELKNILSYLITLKDKLVKILFPLTSLIIENKESNEELKFIQHILCDSEQQTKIQIQELNVAINLIDLTSNKIKKMLPSEESFSLSHLNKQATNNKKMDNVN